MLPAPDAPNKGTSAFFAKDATYPAIEPVRPPAGAPNVLIVLIDDMGFGASSAFGGPIHMPTLERLADDGLRYTRFHNCALCSPTRQALLTGRNCHSVEMGAITEMASSVPGYTSVRPNTAATIAEVLRLNGYNTAAYGKMHQTPVWEVSTSGPFDHWPTGEGFEDFYGWVAAETNQWAPTLVQGTTPVEPPDDPDYHVTPDLVDHAIAWVQSQQALTPDKPFFMYLSFGATHAPHHVPPEWIEKYRGKFDQGWDALREETIARQKELGVVPPDTQLTARSEGIKAWDELSADEKHLATRLMETYAGFAEHTDHHAGRLIDALENMGVLDNTLVIYIAGDNGASAEGTQSGTFNEMITLNGLGVPIEEQLAHIDDIGTPNSYNHYPIGWAHAMDCPYQWTKQIASHWGGTRTGMAMRWPAGFQATGEVRHQFHHVIDIVPTILECAGLPEPDVVNGVTQKPIEGVSMAYTFDDPAAPERRTTQYFEMFGNRGIYHNGWSAVTRHSNLFGPVSQDWSEDVWELYDGSTDWSQAHDLAAEMPEKLAELQQLFLIEAAKYNVFPLDDRRVERLNPEIAGRPDLMGRRTSLTLYPGMIHLMENAVLNVKNKSYSVTAELEIPEGGAEGVIVAQGGRFGGWSLYVKDGKLTYCYNWLGRERYTIAAAESLPAGPVTVRYDFAYDGGEPGAGGTGTLFVNDVQAGQGHIENTVAYSFSLDEGMEVGCDLASPVTDDYPERNNAFTGAIHWVRIDIGQDSADHMLDPERLFDIAMAAQ
ncbi:MAG: arylsulfatase [Chloroflexota bacterium]|nr:arylsulfatase [Chloroflexota bacterium]